jgi:uncharacterized DUF497 family protein
MGFQWDEAKSAANAAKHGVTFLQAAQVFRGPVLRKRDTRRDYGEERFIALGIFDGVVLSVVFTEREGDLRIISAWRAGRHEREAYDRHRRGSSSEPE